MESTCKCHIVSLSIIGANKLFRLTVQILSGNCGPKILFPPVLSYSASHSIPTWLLKKCTALLVPTITKIVNLSLSSGNFHHTLKESVISPLLKKPTLHKMNCLISDQSPTSLFFYQMYANMCVTYLDKLIQLNDKILRILQKCPIRTHVLELYTKFNVLPLDKLHST